MVKNMGNSLNMNILNKFVVIKSEIFNDTNLDVIERVFLVTGGFGSVPFTFGSKIGGYFVADGKEEGWTTISSLYIERLATEDEIEAEKKIKNK